MSFKKRAPRAIKEIKYFAEKAMVCLFLFYSKGREEREGTGRDLVRIVPLTNRCMVYLGYERRPARSAAQQEGLGVRHQGRAISTEGTHLEKTERRGGREGEAV